jgi:heat shock protein HslJ/membrane-bound inhibitor of C-type lysozyme
VFVVAEVLMVFTYAFVGILLSLHFSPFGLTQPGADLTGTSWQLVRFQGGDGTVLTPSNPSNNTIAFGADGRVSARIDCNRGSGTWKSVGPGQLEFGPLALTRAMCPAGSMHDQIAKQWSYIRSHVLRDGRLFLSLMADGGIYAFEPTMIGEKPSTAKLPVTSDGPFTFQCVGSAGTEAISATFYGTESGTLLIERAGSARVAFSTPSASGARYEGAGVVFWEARGEATLTWAGVELRCKRK